jgi:hypothetical protein
MKNWPKFANFKNKICRFKILKIFNDALTITPDNFNTKSTEIETILKLQ